MNGNDERRANGRRAPVVGPIVVPIVVGPNFSSAVASAVVTLLLAAGCRSEPKPPAASTARSASAPVPVLAGAVPMELTASIGGTQYPLKGAGECTYTSDAAIYDVPAAMWHATLKSDGSAVSYVNLTIWQFKNGTPTQLSLALQVTGEYHHIATIKGATIVGAGRARVERSGESATLVVDGTDSRGANVALSLRCAGVTAAVEEGGR